MDQFGKLDSFLGGGGTSNSKSGKSSAGLLPAPVNPSWYDAESKSWYGEKDLTKLSKKDKQGLFPCSMVVQYAKTGRASCRRCGELIEKDVLRLGYPFRWRESEDAYMLWLHPGCYVPEVFGIKEKELNKKICGYSALNNTEKARLWKMMRSTGREKGAASGAKAAKAEYSKGSFGAKEKIPVVPVPKAITQPMLPFQKEGLSWMCRQEVAHPDVCGGVLADEMGMGKTIQAISLLIARPMKEPALVVVPMAAVNQWVQEIERFTVKNTLRVFVYHGAQKARLTAEFKKSDVVVTTYQTLETDYRRQMNKLKVACKWCKKQFLPEKLAFHQKYFCGPTAERTSKQKRTEKKFQDTAKKAMQNMGIGGKASASSVYAPPTITNIYKDYMKQAGVDVKANGYWNIMKETANRNKASSSSSSSSPSSSKDSLNREKLGLMDKQELQELCEKRKVEKSGTKAVLIDRLMTAVVKGMKTLTGVSSRPRLGAQLIAKAKAAAKATAKAKAKSEAKGKLLMSAKAGGSSKYQGVSYSKQTDKWQASFQGHYLGLFGSEISAARAVRDAADQVAAGNGFGPASKKSKKGQEPAKAQAANGYARTAASSRAAAASTSSSSKFCASYSGSSSSKAATKGGKRKFGQDVPAGVPEPEYQTYDGVQLDLSESPLHAVVWSRVILDEAHRIKGRTNSTALAAYALQTSGAKWCLTGTPLQNRVGELYSLIRFLRLRPFAFYYCKKKGCNCECSRFMRERYCPNCGHVRFLHYSAFKRQVSNPIIKFGYMGAGKTAFATLRNDILDKVMLRRTKEERKADLHLKPIKTVIRKDKMSKEEADFYQSLYMQSCVRFDTYVQSGTLLHNYAHIFDLLTSLRRATDHPYLIVYGGGRSSHKLPDGSSLMDKPSKDICALCQDDVVENSEEEPKRVAKCGHVFHDECIRDYMRDAPKLKSGGVGCPTCFTRLCIDLGDGGNSEDEGDDAKKSKGRKGKASSSAVSTPMKRSASKSAPEITPAKRGKANQAVLALPAPPGWKPASGKRSASPAKAAPTKGIMKKVGAANFKSSTKIEAVVDETRKMMKSDSTAKAIIFSQFGAMLELLEFRLKREGISCVVFRGGMTMQARNDALAAFNSDPTLKVILISLKAGGEGLNLQVANHVFLLDPWWNPACELQAIQRAHRIGQTKEVKAVRFIMAGTIEEKIVKLQEKKQLVFDATIDGSSSSLSKLTEQDLRFLFQQ